MAYLLSLLPLLACPIGMGLMMWLMMRGNKGNQTHRMEQAHADISRDAVEPVRPNLLAGLHLCLNWKVVTGLAVVGLSVWIVAPNFLWLALPVLILAACPISMLLMMRGMGGDQGSGGMTQEHIGGSARDEIARS
jgi:DUF2933 family protein